ncbi:MAG: MFS transporter [Bacteroidetes bacterium]|nr:MFS transporter [Bacteroidota bacterium]
MQKKHAVLLILSILSVITFLDRNAISISAVRIMGELSLTDKQFGWVASVFAFSYGIFEIPTGIWGDKFGEKKVIARVVLWWSAFTALTGMVTGFASLLMVRFLFGAGEAGAYPNSAIAVRKWFDAKELGRAQAFIWMSSRIGGAITPFVVVPMQIHFGWRITFYVLGVIGLLWVLVWWWLYEEPKENTHAVQKEETRWKELLSNRNFWLLLLIYYCYASGVFFFISWLPKYLHSGLGIAEKDLTYSASLPFVLAAVGCWFGGSISDALVKRIGIDWGRRVVPMVGLALSGLVMIGATVTTSTTLAVIFLALGLAFMDLTAPVAWAIAIGLGGKNSGAVSGAMNTSGLLGGTVTSAAVGYMISGTGSYNTPVIALGGLLLLGAVFCFFIRVEK